MKTQNTKEHRLEVARDDDEREFMNLLNLRNPISEDGSHFMYAKQSTDEMDQKHHFDVIARKVFPDGSFQVCHFDVKSKQPQNYHTQNYSVSKDCIDFAERCRNSDYFYAFRLIEDKHPSDKFLIVDIRDAAKCKVILTAEDGTVFTGINVNQVRQTCDWEVLEPDI